MSAKQSGTGWALYYCKAKNDIILYSIPKTKVIPGSIFQQKWKMVLGCTLFLLQLKVVVGHTLCFCKNQKWYNVILCFCKNENCR